ncbi:hypothetical protein IGI04_042901 [Brassica rapa subsp. trilocularis]|uniref:Uncharacterized protein n=1 Tax=Brassica rapa subsp. trilocularis TaxID=1813537 RepID=A0ABQ7KKU8_BRACM|nr:hypothetical protein IGI04_042901 [Brassica rapa subsp. trilocularis]
MLVKKLRRIVGLCNQKSNWKTDETRPRPCKRGNLKLGAKRSTRKFAGKVPGKFTGDNPAIDLNPALDSVGPNSPTLRTRTVRKTFFKNINFCIFGFSGDFGCPWVILAHVGCLFSTHGRPCVSVSTHRTSVAVRQHTQDVRGRPSAHTGRPAVHQYTYQHAPWTVRDVRQHTQDVRCCPCVSVFPSVHTGRSSAHTGRPSAHAGRLWLSVCVRVSVSAHRTSVSTHRTSISTRRTSVSTRRTSVAVRVCPCVRQCTQDVRQHTQGVRQHTQDVRQHTQDVRGCPCVSVCPLAHAGRPSVNTGRPSAHKGRPWPSVSTQRTSVAIRQHTQDVRQYTEDVPGRPSAHTGRPSAHAGRPCVSVCRSVHTGRPSAHTGRPSVHTGRLSAHTGRPWSSVSTHISMLALPVDCSGDFGPRGLFKPENKENRFL